MALAEKIRILLVKRGNISEAELARRMEISPQNLHNKMKRDNFTENDLAEIAKALDCTLSVNFTMNDTGETLCPWLCPQKGDGHFLNTFCRNRGGFPPVLPHPKVTTKPVV